MTLTGLFSASFLAAAWILPSLPLRPGGYPKLRAVPHFSKPPGDSFWITSAKQELSQIVLFHDFGTSIEHARQADILFFGNSRQQTGFSEEFIVGEARKLGLSVFTIASGHAEKTRFALELIRRHDLRPKVVVASGGPFVFTEGISPWAKEVLAMDQWAAAKTQWELSATWSLQSHLHHLLPRIDYFNQHLIRGGIKFRSPETGWWRIALEPGGRFPVSTKPERQNYDYTLRLAGELKQELDHRESLLVLTIVPYAGTRSGHLPFLSEKLGSPYVLPSFDGMETSDGSHLNRDSAAHYARAFWEEFIQLEAVRERLEMD